MNANEPTLGAINYFDEVMQSFPDLASEILAEDEAHSYIRMELFASYTVEQFLSKNWETLRACFEFQEQRIHRMDEDLRSALDVSYFDALLLGNAWRNIDGALVYMGPLVLQGYLKYKDWYDSLFNDRAVKLGNKDQA